MKQISIYLSPKEEEILQRLKQERGYRYGEIFRIGLRKLFRQEFIKEEDKDE